MINKISFENFFDDALSIKHNYTIFYMLKIKRKRKYYTLSFYWDCIPQMKL